VLGCGGNDAEKSPPRRRFLPSYHRYLHTCGLPSGKFCTPTRALQSTHSLGNGSFINRKSNPCPLFLVNGQPEPAGHSSLVPRCDTCGFSYPFELFLHLRSFLCVPLHTNTINPSPLFYSISSRSFSLPSRLAVTPISSINILLIIMGCSGRRT
jgi:hypothetical protein